MTKRWISVPLLALAVSLGAATVGPSAKAAATSQCYANHLTYYNSVYSTQSQSIGFSENFTTWPGDACISHHGSDFASATGIGIANWVLGNDGVLSGPLRIYWTNAAVNGDTISNFTLDGVAINPNTSILIPATGDHKHTITYTHSTSGLRKISFELNADDKTFTNNNLVVVDATPAPAASPVNTGQQTVDKFVENRSIGISNVQPKIGDFFTGSGGSFIANGSDDNLTANYAASVILDPASQSISDSFAAVENANRAGKVELWTQIYGANTDAGNSNDKLWVGYFGGHTFLSEDMLIGALVQVDYADSKDKVAGSDGHGTGWMVGPYIAGKITGQDVFYEARMAIGGSDNKISPTGAYTDSFETERWMVSGGLSGAYEWGEITFSPNIGISYFSEKQKGYTDSLANVIPSQTITSGEISFGPEISKEIALDSGATLIPKAGLSAIYTYESASTNAAQVLTFKDGDLRAKLDFGLSLLALNGMVLSSDLFYDGFGISDYESWGGQVKWTVPLQ